MLIGPDFIIGHIPKTGGHALAVMMHNANISFQSPFTFTENKAITTPGAKKHGTFEQLYRKNPKILNGKRLFLILRKLPDWFFSIILHHTIHSELDSNFQFQRVGVLKTYEVKFKEKKLSTILSPSVVAYCTFPDSVLKRHIRNSGKKINYLRMEFLIDDIKKYLGIELKNIDYFHSYSTNFSINSDKY